MDWFLYDIGLRRERVNVNAEEFQPKQNAAAVADGQIRDIKCQ